MKSLLAALATTIGTLAACGGGDSTADSSSATSRGSVALTGAGATFPYPLYARWISDYNAATGIRINYQSIGSGGGIRQLSEGTVDFGASDGPMTDDELRAARGGHVLHIPMALGADVITYNLPEVSTALRLDGPTIADIFLGSITRWNDARIAQLNPGVTLPERDILVVHRSDGSGTTWIFTDYLSAISPAWASGPGRGKAVDWPVGLGGKGNEGVAGQIKQTPGTIGYVELAYAHQNRLAIALVKNAAGEFVEPTVASITAAAAGAIAQLPDSSDYRISIVNADGADAYPISSFTWILVYRVQTDAEKGRKLIDFLKWSLAEGADAAIALDYAPLPPELVARLNDRLDSVQLGAP
jgi:phosphate transport system substrate-binding protein